MRLLSTPAPIPLALAIFIVLFFVGNSVSKRISDVLPVLHASGLFNEKGESRIPFPLLPPGTLPPALPISDTTLELNTDIIQGNLSLEQAVIFGLDGLYIISDLSLDYDHELIVNLANVTGKVNSLNLDIKNHESDVTITSPFLDGYIYGNGELNIALTNLTLDLNIQLRLINDSKLVAEVLTFGLDLDELIITAENFTIILGEDVFDPANLLEFLKLVVPVIWPQYEPMVLELLGGLLSGFLENCKLTDLIGGGLGCTGLFPSPTMAPTEYPPTTVRNTPPPVRDSAPTTFWGSSGVHFILAVQMLVTSVFWNFG